MPGRRLVLTLIIGMLVGPFGLNAQEAATPAAPTETAAQTAQETPTSPDYSVSSSFLSVFSAYHSRYVPEPRMNNSELIHTLIRDGKLYLSLDDAVALAIQNNLDIDVARYTPAFAETDLLRARAGGANRGVTGMFQSTALFAGAVGAGLSSGGGTSTGSGGGFSGSGGAINPGSNSCCDPFFFLQAGWDRATSPLNVSTLYGVPNLTNQTTNMGAFFGQGFLTGTSYTVGMSGYRQSTNSTSVLFNPEVFNGGIVGISQQFLNGFGYRANAKFIRIAQRETRLADSQFRQQAITSIAAVETQYWNLVSAREQVHVAQQALALSERLLSDNKKQVEIGTLAPLEVIRAQAQVAADQQTLIVNQTTSRQQGETLKTLIAKRVDAQLSAAEVVPTDKLPEPANNDIPALEQALELAQKNRPEIEQADLNLSISDITIAAVRNSMLPTLQGFATWAPTGLGGTEVLRDGKGNIIGYAPGGFGDAVSQTFRGNYPNYSFGINLSIPIRNRQAQADAARALLEERQLRVEKQRSFNQIGQDVRNAEIAVIQAKAQINASIKAVDLAQQTLDADQKKFNLGETTVFQLIQDQRDLTTQQGNRVTAYSNYAKALTQFGQATGTTLDQAHVQLSEAKTGRVTKAPNIPGTPSTPGNE